MVFWAVFFEYAYFCSRIISSSVIGIIYCLCVFYGVAVVVICGMS